jgi:hypothetical protein
VRRVADAVFLNFDKSGPWSKLELLNKKGSSNLGTHFKILRRHMGL